MTDPTGFDRDDAAFAALLADSLDAPMPPGLAARVDAVVAGVGAAAARRWLVVRGAAAALGLTFAVHAFGNFFRGEWVAEHLHETYAPHPYNEGGGALVGMALLLLVAAVRPRLLSASALVAAPVATYYGVLGVGEADEFLNGAVLHIAEGLLGLALVLSLLWARRYVLRRPHEGGA